MKDTAGINHAPSLASRSITRRSLLAGTAAIATLSKPALALAFENNREQLSDASMYEDYVGWAESHYQPDPLDYASQHYEAHTFEEAREARWTQSALGKTFLDGNGDVFLSPAIKVIDVSTFQKTINWELVKSSGVDAAILRCGYGVGNEDEYFKRNLRECERLNIPYGVYLYSYAYDENFALREGGWTAQLLKRYNAQPSLPIYYDLENWTWTGHKPPTSSSDYEKIVDAYFSALRKEGYSNVSIYSYKSYLNGPLKSPHIWSLTSWVAQYSSSLDFDVAAYSPGFYGWQYTSSGSIHGINGTVDLNAFTPISLYGFTDVTHATPHHEDIGWLKLNGIAEGFNDHTFRGAAAIARQDMAAMLYHTAGSPSYTPSDADAGRFVDISPATPHYLEICWLGSNNIAEGWGDGTYRGLASVTRQDMAAFLYRLAGSPSYSPSPSQMHCFIDVNEATPHSREIWWLASTGISTGFPDGSFRGLNPVTRQDMAAFLHRLHAYTNGNFPV